jgi:hypothetical protein
LLTFAKSRPSTARRDDPGRIILGDHYRAHHRITTRVEHVIATLKDPQILPQCRGRGQAINHSLEVIARPWNLNTRNQLRINS